MGKRFLDSWDVDKKEFFFFSFAFWAQVCLECAWVCLGVLGCAWGVLGCAWRVHEKMLCFFFALRAVCLVCSQKNAKNVLCASRGMCFSVLQR